MSIISEAAGWLFGGSNSVEKSLDLASQYIEDKDQRNQIIGQIIAADMARTVPWVDALHKMGRQMMIVFLMYIYWDSVKAGHPLDMETFLTIAAGPGAYILLKGKGR